MFAVYRRELNNFFHTINGYLFLALMLFTTGICVTGYNFMKGYTRPEISISDMSLAFAVLIPLLTIPLMAGERKRGTDALLAMLPIKPSDVVLGKFFALFSFSLIPTVVYFAYALLVGGYTSVNYGSFFSCLICYIFYCAAMCAVGTFISAVSKNYVVAGIVTYGSFVVLYLLGIIGTALTNVIAKENDNAGDGAAAFINDILPFSRLSAQLGGVFDPTAIVYFLIIACLFVFLTVRSAVIASAKR